MPRKKLKPSPPTKNDNNVNPFLHCQIDYFIAKFYHTFTGRERVTCLMEKGCIQRRCDTEL